MEPLPCDTTTAEEAAKSSPKRRLWMWVIGAMVVLGTIALSLTLSGVFSSSNSSSPSSEVPSSTFQSEASTTNSGDCGPSPSFANGTATSSTSKNVTRNNNNSTSAQHGDDANKTTSVKESSGYPTDPFQLLEGWDGSTETITLTNGELVKVRWPECVGMEGQDCEDLVWEENPYVTMVYVLGLYDYVTQEFRNDRVHIWTGEDGVVFDSPMIG